MFLNIITPCSRPDNLKTISLSINIPRENYRWIVVFDSLQKPDYIPENCESYCFKHDDSVVGHAQRNFALDLIDHGHVYFNDDDTIIHNNLWEEIKELDEDFISFMQEEKDGNLRLKGNDISLNYVDSHNFIVSRNCVKKTKFITNRYDADGFFAFECHGNAETKIYIEKVLSVYNALR